MLLNILIFFWIIPFTIVFLFEMIDNSSEFFPNIVQELDYMHILGWCILLQFLCPLVVLVLLIICIVKSVVKKKTPKFERKFEHDYPDFKDKVKDRMG